jgi:hypothetical protein
MVGRHVGGARVIGVLVSRRGREPVARTRQAIAVVPGVGPLSQCKGVAIVVVGWGGCADAVGACGFV